MVVIVRTNDALHTNPPKGDQYLSENGSNWLWAVTALYGICFISVYGLSFSARSGEKIFHYLFSIALLVGTISYFAQASDLGWSLVLQADNSGNMRQIFFPKYINWAVAFPVVTIAMGLVSGAAWASIVHNVVLSWIGVLSFLSCAYTPTLYKWGFYTFGSVALVLYMVGMGFGNVDAKRVGSKRQYGIMVGAMNILCSAYISAIGNSDAGNVLGVTSAFIFFGVIDILMVPVMAGAFLVLSRKWDYGKLNIAFTQYGRVAHGGFFPGKVPASRDVADQPVLNEP